MILKFEFDPDYSVNEWVFWERVSYLNDEIGSEGADHPGWAILCDGEDPEFGAQFKQLAIRLMQYHDGTEPKRAPPRNENPR